MGIDNKIILEHSKKLNLLYVEDDEALRESTTRIFNNYFNKVIVAVDGEDGLDKYMNYFQEHNQYIDLVISDIKMPNMNGIDMAKAIMEENGSQSFAFMSAHNEASYLHSAIKMGVYGFLIKPVDFEQLKTLLYRTTLAISDHKMVQSYYAQVESLNIQLMEEKAKLEKQIELFKIEENVVEAKHNQVECLLQKQADKTVDEKILKDYFNEDHSAGNENVVFYSDDIDELLEIFDELQQQLSRYKFDKDRTIIENAAERLKKVSLILLHYSPYMDLLAKSFEELSISMVDSMDKFIEMIENNSEDVLRLFDAVGSDMDRYIKRFSVESMAMDNIHHIHHPTTLSIQQIVGMFNPEDIEDGEIEFF